MNPNHLIETTFSIVKNNNEKRVSFTQTLHFGTI
jgi:hypothetical protein